VEEKISVMGRQGRRRKQLLDEFKGTRGYCKLGIEALIRAVWRIRFRCVSGPLVKQTVEMNIMEIRVRKWTGFNWLKMGGKL